MKHSFLKQLLSISIFGLLATACTPGFQAAQTPFESTVMGNISLASLASSTPAWNNSNFTTGSFVLTFDAVPTTSEAAGEDSVIGLSDGSATAYTDLAAIVRFGSNGIDARNGGTYSALVSTPYTAGLTYLIEMDVNVTSHTYSVYATPAGGSKAQIARNWSFRTEQATVAALTDFGYYSDVGGITISNVMLDISLAASPAAPAPAPSPSSSASCSKGSSYSDGCANAPAGSPQFPNQLNGYAVRPPWNVAGVDYAVGVPAGTVLQDPSTINIPGVTVNTASHQVAVSTDNATISGIDFSLDGGWQLVIYASNVTVKDCNFAVGANAQPMLAIGGSNTLLEYSTFNGNSIFISSLNGVVYSLGGAGAMTIQYCYFENGSEDWVDSPNNAPVTLEYNLWVNNGQGGGHPDWLELGGGNISAVVEYNTYVQSKRGPGGSQGIGLYDAYSGSYDLTSATVSNNTIVTLPDQGVQVVNYIIHIGYSGTIVGSGTGGLTGTATIQNNYVDMSGAGSFFGAQSGSGSTPQAGASVVESGNVNMVTGASLY